MLDIVHIDKLPRVFYNGYYLGYLEKNWLNIPLATHRYVDQGRKDLKIMIPDLNVVWLGRMSPWNKTMYD